MDDVLYQSKLTLKEKLKYKFQDYKYEINQFFVKQAVKIIRNSAKKSNYIYHARQEFLALGYKPIDELEDDDPNKWIQMNVFELLSMFGTQGHSGFSATFCSDCFNKLSRFKPLSPIKCSEDEWSDVSFGDHEQFQNKRLSAVFKEGEHGKPYYIDAIVWKDQNDLTFTGTVENISSSQYIKLPFNPKTFYIDVISTEVEKDNWESKIKDRGQLTEVFEYYEKGLDDYKKSKKQ